MIRKLIWGMIKSALSPLFIALAVLRKTKNAILKIFGVSRKAATTAADATEKAKDAAETAAEKRETEGASDGQHSVDSQPTSRVGASAQLADVESQYQRFQNLLIGLVLYVALLPVVLGLVSGSLQFISIGDLLRASVFAAALPAVLAGLARVRSKYAWGITLGLSVLLAAGSVLQLVGFVYISSSPLGPTTGPVAANQPVVYIVAIGQILLLGAILWTGWKGRQAVYSDPGRSSQPTAANTDETKAPDQSDSSVDQQAPTATSSTETDHKEPTSGGVSSNPTGDARDQSPTEATPSASPDAAVAEPKQGTETTTRGSRGIEEDTTTEGSVATDGSEEHPTEINSIVEELDTDPVTPDKIRALGDELPTKDVPKEAITALRRYEDADDPDVRSAVCELCSSIEDEWADDILKNRRIDTNDQVATTAINALR